MASIPPSAFSAGRIRETQRGSDMKLSKKGRDKSPTKYFNTVCKSFYICCGHLFALCLLKRRALKSRDPLLLRYKALLFSIGRLAKAGTITVLTSMQFYIRVSVLKIRFKNFGVTWMGSV